MIYTRLYSDAHGESHFEDVGIELTLTNYAPPAPPLELTSFMIAMARRAFPAGSVLLVEDTTGKGHSSRVASKNDSLAAMVQLPDP